MKLTDLIAQSIFVLAMMGMAVIALASGIIDKNAFGIGFGCIIIAFDIYYLVRIIYEYKNNN